MLDHVTIGVSNFPRAMAFYDAALAPLGITRRSGDATYFAGYGTRDGTFFWIDVKDGAITSTHVALAVADRAAVDRFHEAAVAAGGRDNGRPGLRAQHHPDYYAAYVFDPDGHNIEAVCRQAT